MAPSQRLLRCRKGKCAGCHAVGDHYCPCCGIFFADARRDPMIPDVCGHCAHVIPNRQLFCPMCGTCRNGPGPDILINPRRTAATAPAEQPASQQLLLPLYGEQPASRVGPVQ